MVRERFRTIALSVVVAVGEIALFAMEIRVSVVPDAVVPGNMFARSATAGMIIVEPVVVTVLSNVHAVLALNQSPVQVVPVPVINPALSAMKPVSITGLVQTAVVPAALTTDMGLFNMS